MSNVIDFLERMGQDAHLRQGSQDEVELALASAKISPELRTAILARNQTQLEALLGQIPLCAVFFPSKEDDDEESEETPSREPDEDPEQSEFDAVATAA